MNDKLVMIDISEIYPNKDNPRKDIGDIEELTKSIEKNGLMQNLTVVPGHWENDLAYTAGYTLLIGHRRYAAAKAAGLTEVPCRIVSGMDKREQVSTMLEENMQRADLTAYEQAAGFQMMMDLGDSEEDLAEKTGFSKRTIQHRLNLAKLDKDVLKEKSESDEFQLSLTDMYELEKVKSIDKRNEILKKASKSSELIWLAHNAADEEKREERYITFAEWCKEAGASEAPKDVQRNYWGKYDVVESISLKEDKDKPDDFEEKVNDDCMYFRSYSFAEIIKPKSEDEDDDENEFEEVDEEEERLQRNGKKAEEIIESLQSRLRSFIFEIIDGHISDITPDERFYESAFNVFIESETAFRESTLITYYTDKLIWELSKEEMEEAESNIYELPTHHKILLLLASEASYFETLMSWSCSYSDENVRRIRKAFDMLARWGWVLEEDEERLLNGSSYLYDGVPQRLARIGLCNDAECPECKYPFDDSEDKKHKNGDIVECPSCKQKIIWSNNIE